MNKKVETLPAPVQDEQARRLTIAIEQRAAQVMESLITKGDLAALTPQDRVVFYNETCASLGLNPITRPFEFIVLDRRLTMYARKDCAEQLRRIYNVSTEIVEQKLDGDLYVVTVRASIGNRVDEDVGAVPMAKGAAGAIRANCIKKAITQAKRRATLSICGLGFMDESEVEDAQAATTAKATRKGAVRTITSGDVPETVAGNSETPPIDGSAGNTDAGKTDHVDHAADGDGATGQESENPAPNGPAAGEAPAKATGEHPPVQEAEKIPPRKADASEPPAKIEGRTADDWDVIMRQIAETGDMKKLELTWTTIPTATQKILTVALNRRYKPACEEAAAKKPKGGSGGTKT